MATPITAAQRILALAGRRGLVTAADVRALGIAPQSLIKLFHAGKLERMARGVYGLPERAPGEHETLALVCSRVPRAVVCLLSALQFHDIGTQLPGAVWIALPEGSRTPPVAYPPLRVARLRGAAYADGVETRMADGLPIRVYGVAKTLADCFKFRHRIGLDVALEALKDAWRQRKFTMDELTRFARIDRVERVMQPYLEALAA